MSFKTGQVENINFPWFKERLKTKYLRDLRQKQQLSGALDSRKWRFLPPGLDDFRDGYPTVHKEPFTQSKCGPSPVVFGMPNPACSVKLQQKRLSKNQMCYSKQNPQSQARREFIDAVEHKLKQHPLALYPYLESGMTAELFEQVLSVLDPDMCVMGELPTTSPTKAAEKPLEESKPQSEISTQETIKPSITDKPLKEKRTDTRPRNPYKYQELKESGAQTTDVKQSQEYELMTLKRFFEWITSLGGETSDLKESTILDLFKSDYEKKTTLNSPINKTDPDQPPGKPHSSVEEPYKGHSNKELTQAFKPNKLKTAYDSPKALADIKGNLDFEEEPSEQDKELRQIHGIQAFKEFIINKGVRMPKLLSVIFSEEEQMKIRGSTSSTSKGTNIHENL